MATTKISADWQKAADDFGLIGVPKIADACVASGLPFWAACAFIELETGGANVYGAEEGGTMAGFLLPVTKGNWEVFRWLVVEEGCTTNGVGPCQIYKVEDFLEMEKQKMRPYHPFDNMVFAFGKLKESHDKFGKSWRHAGNLWRKDKEFGPTLVDNITEWRARFGIGDPKVSK